MNGAELILKTAKKAGIEVCFTNFGTSEVPLALAFEAEPGIRPVLGLFEGVCTGAADGWGKMRDRPALTLLHLGPGLANGTANLHNAKKSKTPLINLVGEHTSQYKHIDSPLAMDIEKLAGTVSGWCRTSQSPSGLSQDMAEAYASAMYGQISTLIIPTDYQEAETGDQEIASPRFTYEALDEKIISSAARLMRSRTRVGLILGGRALRRRGLRLAARIQALTGCDLITHNLPSYIERGAGWPEVIRLPYFPEPAIEILSRYEAVVLAGAAEPTCFFGGPNIKSHLLPEGQPRVHLATLRQNEIEALEQLADALKGPARAAEKTAPETASPAIPDGSLTAEKASATLAAVQPEGAIIVDEAISSAFPYYSLSKNALPHTLINIVGGAMGWGLPCSIGAAIACPDRPVIDFQADGAALMTVQSLWTQARQGLNITTLVCSNRSYNILKLQLERDQAAIGPLVHSLIDIENPSIDWVKVSEGMGVPAVKVSTGSELAREIRRALADSGPHLIEMVLP